MSEREPAEAPSFIESCEKLMLQDWLRQMIFAGADASRQDAKQYANQSLPSSFRIQWANGETGRPIAVLVHEPVSAEQLPWILFFYGNAMCLLDCLPIAVMFARLGFNVAVVEYIGYGLTGGSPSEAGCTESSLAAYNLIVSQMRVRPSSIAVVGWSLGSAVAIQLAATREVGAVVALSAFTSLPAIAQHLYKLPFLTSLANMVMADRFDALRSLQTVRCPVLFVHGQQDRLMPVQMATTLAATLPAGQAEVLVIPGVGHNDLLDENNAPLMQRLREFLAAHVYSADT